MQQFVRSRWKTLTALAVFATAAAWPASSAAQTVTGQARAVQATVVTVLGTDTTVLSDTGTLSAPADARENSQDVGAVPSVLTGNTLHASTIGWADQAASEASVADLAISVGGSAIGADFVMSRAIAGQGAAGTALVDIDSLTINGVAIAVTGQPNQTVGIPGGRVVINEQQSSTGRAVVNALHVVVDGVADVVVASSTAAIQ